MHFVIVDDHPLFREALLSTVQVAFPGAVVDEAESLSAASEAMSRAEGVDMILLDLSMQGVTGFDGLIQIRASFPKVPILVVSGFEDAQIAHDAIRCGAAGYVPKGAGKALLTEAMTEVLGGGVFLPKEYRTGAKRESGAGSDLLERLRTLTPAQMRVLSLVKRGKLNKQIAYELNVGESTIKAHISEIMRKLGVASRTQAVIETSSLDFDVILRGGKAD